MTPAPIKPSVPISALEALDIRVGTITAVQEIPQSSKLLRLIVDFGDHGHVFASSLHHPS
jgi:tRNA-binding protein